VWEIKSDAILRHLIIKPAPQMAFLFRIYRLLGTQQWDISKLGGGLLVIDGLGIGNWGLGIGDRKWDEGGNLCDRG
jgi:hypothetical protein